MIDLLLALIVTGHCAYYNPGVMERVVDVRITNSWGGLTEEDVVGVIGFIATDNCNEIGGHVFIWHNSEGWKGPYLVADCCNRVDGHCRGMHHKNIVLEVDYNTAKRWNILNHGPKGNYVAIIRDPPSFLRELLIHE